ncbi:uncharacterized protein LOC122058080 isoform X3 [Macadamia integrifolia]|uniref:uncharacterized protein LOC122058080 isoform X3 n=1 Tax=Macadamia integrifolia TaxID=60698 RepID=UPI001C530CDA|nr:uncharacterized protein LOC122058080 isoform X3 [Macadamia integrifolia]
MKPSKKTPPAPARTTWALAPTPVTPALVPSMMTNCDQEPSSEGLQPRLFSLDSDTPDYTEKYNKYEADYVRRLKAKYFSKKDLYGGIIFDKEDAIDDEIIKSSRFPSTRSFTDPVNSFEDQSRFSASAAESSANHPNRKPQCKKSNS